MNWAGSKPYTWLSMISGRPRLARRWAARVLFWLLLLMLWEWGGQHLSRLLFAPFSATLAALWTLLREPETYRALWVSNQSLLLGYPIAVAVGVPTGLAMGRWRRFEGAADLYLNALLVTPMAAVIPLMIMATGIGLLSRSLVVFAFALPVIAVNARAGLKQLDPSLLQMGTAYGATELKLWRHIMLPAAAPAIFAGLRLGLGRALTGMILVELLLIAVGLGRIILEALGAFQPARAYAAILLLIVEIVLLMYLMRRLESRVLRWQGAAV